MKRLDEISIVNAFRYRAPSLVHPQPSRTKPGFVTVEVLVGGAVYAPAAGLAADRREVRGAVFCHFPGEFTVHKSDLSDPYHCISLHFSGAQVLKKILPARFEWSDIESLDSYMAELLRLYHAYPSDHSRLAHRILGEFVWQMRGGGKFADNRPQALISALNAIEERFAELQTMRDLSRITGVSVPILHRIFRENGGSTAWSLISRRKLREARYLLTSSFLSIKETAFRSGFQSVEHFCRSFRAEFGKSPREYRNSMHSGSSVAPGIEQGGKKRRAPPPPAPACRAAIR